MFPELEFDEAEETLPAATMGKVFLFDFKEQKYVLKDGKPVEASYEEAIKQWVSMVLITETDKYPVYGPEFGIGIAKFIGRKDIPLATITSEVGRQITETIVLHPEVTGIEELNVKRGEGKAILSFRILTRRGIIDGFESEVRYSG
ncbi:DUF2634 domain-containing protein [Paenibacillus solani]|uniref:DUF2634 domain-containing protein n=1 Tax=Paenibacillus solani TaxID=1705565 RepID=A0A0M1P2R2_9BACL|nr:DUF2634 domain-containing protein [Paenibacillus solani]KOR88783.1 hypothetical protein AM231_06155 [Paenibacillus solani]